MKLLSLAAQEQVNAFFTEQARPLERARYQHHIFREPVDAIYEELAKFQNSDGGFGHGLEPDIRLEDSSALATTIGLQILRETSTSESRPLVEGTIAYLLNTYDANQMAWAPVPPNVDDAPHAPWWGYGGSDLSGYYSNPCAEILGYFHDYSDLVPQGLLEEFDHTVMSRLERLGEDIESHDLLCYRRLSESRSLPEKMRQNIVKKLEFAADRTVAKDPSDWQDYVLMPLSVVRSPDSVFADLLTAEVSANLDFEVEQLEKGTWEPTWSWGDRFPEEWQKAAKEWKAVITLCNVMCLHRFGRFE